MTDYSVRDLIPHSGNMILIDTILSCAENTLSARTTIRAGGPFNNPDGSLPGWLGLELMAQGIAAWAGYHARQVDHPVQLGFLLGTRRYECKIDHFSVGAVLRIDIARTLQDDTGIGVFECTVHGDELLASARVNVFQPPDTALYLQDS